MAASPTIVWFRLDLRLADQPALSAAVARGGPLVPVYVLDDAGEGDWPPGGAARWWLHHSLAALAGALRERGSRLVLRRGAAEAQLVRLARETGAGAVAWSRRVEPSAREQQERVTRALAAAGVTALPQDGALLCSPDEVRTGQGGPFQVFTPFWKACLASGAVAAPRAAPRRLPPAAAWPDSLALAELGLLPRPDWAGGLAAAWTPGEAAAAARLRDFLAGSLPGYPRERDRPDRDGTSRLSPHLHFGEISPRQAWRAVHARAQRARSAPAARGAEALLRQLGWREFAHHLLWHFPHTAAAPLRREFADFPWRADAAGLRAWRRGRTGCPLVDAGMRQLWRTGWMHNRARMVVASYLVKDLLLPWQAGARWFWDTLVDADLANNTLGWQWTAGCGADAAPFFRVFNPALQGAKFDPDGAYVRRWVPELADLPAAWIQRPHAAPAGVLAEGGVRPGRDYPRPLVDHAAARQRALRALRELKRS